VVRKKIAMPNAALTIPLRLNRIFMAFATLWWSLYFNSDVDKCAAKTYENDVRTK
jgi:hypothetical protein